ncbi:MAG TPA: AI-2E family transporter [Hyphomicrobiaceae bacterium]|nr:AI-2E family transporter [Hyphomicrobiaceae bacterium]
MRIDRQALFWTAALGVVLVLLSMLKGMLLPFVAGFVLAYFLNPAVDALERAGLGRTLASSLMVVAGVLLIAAMILVLAPILAEHVRLLSETLPGDLQRARATIEKFLADRLGPGFASIAAGIDKAMAALEANSSGLLSTAAQAIWSRGQAIVSMVSLLLVTPLVVFYLLVDWHRMADRVDGWLPREHAPAIRAIATDVNAAMAAFIRGQGLICVILSIFYAIALTLAGIPYGGIIGVTTGLLSFIPFVGWMLGLIVAAGVALAKHWPALGPLVLVVAIFAAGMLLDSFLLSPRLVGERLGLHPLTLLFALAAFSYLFGTVGLMIAVPLSAAFVVVARHGLKAYLASDVFQGEALPAPLARPTTPAAGALPVRNASSRGEMS